MISANVDYTRANTDHPCMLYIYRQVLNVQIELIFVAVSVAMVLDSFDGLKHGLWL